MKSMLIIATLACAFAAVSVPRAAAESTVVETKDEYVKKARAQLDELSGKIDALERDAKKAGSTAHADLDQTLADLKARRKTAKKDLFKLRRSSGKAWGDMKVGVDKSLTDLREAIDKALKD